jgi:D-threo-aldose 1-dehydrogenase
VGRFLAGKPGDEFVLSTKVGRRLRHEGVPDPSNYVDGETIFKGVPDQRPVFDFSAQGVPASLRESYQRLGLQRIDVACVHDPDNHWEPASQEALGALRTMRSAKVVSGIGAGMNRTAMLARFVRESDVDVVLILVPMRSART